VRAEWGIGDDETVIGVVARVDPASRRHAIFLDAVARLDGNLRSVFVGAGSPLGFRGDMPAVYSALDALCSPSLWEGFPNAVAEAMACGVPCVVTDTGDSAEVVADCGVVVPPGDPARLAEGIRELLARDARPDDVRELITSRFSVARYAQATEAALGAVAGSSLQASSPEAAGRPEASEPHARSRP
jgi:glycosyltransferase involved in cell wall biosynthesis